MTGAPGRSWKWWMCGALLLATMLNYMDRQTLSLTATQLKLDIHLDDGRYGQLERWFSYAFAAGGIAFGFVADRIGPRRLYPIVLLGWSAAGIASPLASWPTVVGAVGDPASPGLGEFRWLLACRTLLGFFEAGHWPCALLTARNILADTDRPLGNSILQSGASLGAVLTPLIIQAMRATGFPWQAPFFVIGLIGLVWVPIWLGLVRRGDVVYSPPARPRGPDANPLNLGVQLVVLMVIVVTISLAWQFHRAWLPKYLKEHHGYSESTANYFTSGYYLVADVGCLFFGAVVSVLTRFHMPFRTARLIGFAGCAALVSLSAVVPRLEPGPLLFLALLAVGAGALGAHPQYYALAQELPARHMGLLSGVLSATSWVAVGYMQGEMGDYIKQTSSYDWPLVVTGLAPLVGLTTLVVWMSVTKRPIANG
jgi:MFS transporter, ACS family, hexuronate transporter